MARHIVVGTAGHVDHGKTTLVRALTGVDCDRLPEEKARGITIELGYARWQIADGLSASIVDVPGHERFVQTMVSGATGIDLVLLVVAADDGVMPQTREHLAICELLGVRAGVIAITKADLADDDVRALVAEDVQGAVAGTFLEAAPVVACSVRDGLGLGALAGAVAGAAPASDEAAAAEAPFLAIDRVFAKAGFGAIVTGTLTRGAVAVGDELDLLPTARGEVGRVRVRGLSVHDAPVERVRAPTRVAVNVRGADDDDLRRGAVLTAPGSQSPTRTIEARVRWLAESEPLKKRSDLVMHLGTTHRSVSAAVVGADSLRPGEQGVLRLKSAEPFAAFSGQSIVLRRPDLLDNRTLGGGLVLDPHPGGTRGASRGHALLPLLAVEPSERVLRMVEDARGRGIDAASVAQRIPAGESAEALLAGLARQERVTCVEIEGKPRYVLPERLAEAKDATARALAAIHEQRPTAAAISAAEVETQLPLALRSLAPHALDLLVREERVARGEGGTVRLATHRTSAPQEAQARVLEQYSRAGLAPPLDDEAQRTLSLDARTFRDALVQLKRHGRLVCLREGLHVAQDALGAVPARLADHFRKQRELTPGDLKTMFGLSRKHAIPLLEWLDREALTRRTGASRVAGPRLRV